MRPAKWGVTINLRCKNRELRMSLMGQYLPKLDVRVTSASFSIATA
jgi:hypothetical protein